MSAFDERPRNRVGEKARFKDPDTHEIRKVSIVDETAFIPDDPHSPNRRYWRGVELLKWPDGLKELRFCYKIRVRDENGKYRWVNGSQTSLHLSIPAFKELYEEMRQRGWLNEK